MVNSNPLKLGVIGNPIRHSRSPEIHQHFGRMKQLNVQYSRYHAEIDTFEDKLREFFSVGGRGLNVTLPFKEAAAKFADKLTPRAAMVGAVNTLVYENNELLGDTTDGEGFIRDIQRLAGAAAFQGDIVVLGAGGAVKSLLPDLMALNPKRLFLFNRTSAKADALIKQVEAWRSEIGFTTTLVSGGLPEFAVLMRQSSSKVSLLVQGASGNFGEIFGDNPGVDLSETSCYDLNYGVRAVPFLQWCESNHAKNYFDGWGMLVGQAAASFNIWTGKTINVGDAMSELETQNIWQASWWAPPFHAVDIASMRAAVESALQEKETALNERFKQLCNGVVALTWSSFVQFYEEKNDRLARVWGALSHINSVASSDESRAAYNELQPILSDHHTKEQQNPLFKQLVGQLLQSPEAGSFSPAQKKWCANTLRDFTLLGADLPKVQQKIFSELEAELAQLTTQFADQVLDATEAWHLDVLPGELTGVPSTAIESAQDAYKVAVPEASEILCRLNLKGPCYLAVIKFCENQEVRRQIYTAYATRASDQGPHAGQYDTTVLMRQIVYKRAQQARLLGYATYAEYSLATKMASSSDEVVGFLRHLGLLSKEQALREKQELESFATEELGIPELQPWDYAFVSEKLKSAAFALDAEAIRDYFPTDHVLRGLCDVLERLFGVRCSENSAIPVYHEDVRFFELKRDEKLIGGLFIDLYARDKKRGGAWMDECRQRLSHDGNLVLPVAYLVCNSSAPTQKKPSLMTHDEVVTLFHEAGHCLHHVLTEIDVAGVAGIQGVEWDAVEVPSQLLENWCYQVSVIPLLSQHYETGKPLPEAELEKIIAARNFQSGLSMMKQLEYSMFDIIVHSSQPESEAEVPSMVQLSGSVREEFGVLPVPHWHRFSHAFSHIFAGGYAAGYYGYKWAEVYAADLFTLFQQSGPLSAELGAKLCQEWMAMGGVRPASDNFQAIMARDVDLNALINDLGIQSTESL